MKALIFDMDGLMIDSERLYFQAQRDIADKYEKPLKEETLWKKVSSYQEFLQDSAAWCMSFSRWRCCLSINQPKMITPMVTTRIMMVARALISGRKPSLIRE